MSEQENNSPKPRRQRVLDTESLHSQHEKLVLKSRRKKNKALFSVVGISLLIHIIALVIFGGWAVYKYTQIEDERMEAPPPMTAIDPVKVEYKVRMQNLAESQSARPQARVLTVQQVSDISTPSVDFRIDPTTSRVNLATNTSNMGGGLGRALGGGGIGFGVSAVDFFGIRTQGEKIVFIIDVSRSMVEQQRGDLIGFRRVKDEVIEMVNKLSPGTLFNVYTFDNRLDVFQQQLVPATDSNKAAVAEWINPYWDFTGTQITGRQGSTLNNFRPEMPDWEATGGHTRLDIALMAAFQQNADTVFVLTDGIPQISRRLTDEERAQLAREIAEWERRGPPTDREREAYQRRVQEFNEARRKEDEDRRRRGLPPRIREGGGVGQPPWARPTMHRSYTGDEIINYLRGQGRTIYESRGLRVPSVNIVGYSVSSNHADFLNRVRRAFPNSRYRDIGALVSEREVLRMYEEARKAEQGGGS